MQMGIPEKGDFRGYEVDLLEEVRRRLGFRLSFRRALWSVIVSELIAGDVDLVCSAATATKERQREVDFCIPHLKLALAVVKRDGIAVDTAIKGLRLGVRRGTTAEVYAKQHADQDQRNREEVRAHDLNHSLAATNRSASVRPLRHHGR